MQSLKAELAESSQEEQESGRYGLRDEAVRCGSLPVWRSGSRDSDRLEVVGQCRSNYDRVAKVGGV